MIHRHLRISGRVQGVWYRAWMVERAEAMGIDGWVRNRADGSVEALLTGLAEQVDALIALAAEGPPGARVDAVAASDAPAGARRGFEKRPTV